MFVVVGRSCGELLEWKLGDLPRDRYGRTFFDAQEHSDGRDDWFRWRPYAKRRLRFTKDAAKSQRYHDDQVTTDI